MPSLRKTAVGEGAVTEDLRALLLADLSAERPPPLGDLVEAAIRDGHRIRRRRRLATMMAGCAAVAALASGAVIVGDEGIADGHLPTAGARVASASPPQAGSPQSVPPVPAAPTAAPQARTLTIHSGTARADGPRRKATSAAMLHLLTQLIPPGRTSHYGAGAENDLRVQLYLDDGTGPAMVRVRLDRAGEPGQGATRVVKPPSSPVAAPAENYAPASDEPAHPAAIRVTIQHMPDNCLLNTVVNATWPDGTAVHVEVPSCLPATGAPGRPTRSALTPDQAVRVAADPRWGVTMPEELLDAGARQFPRVPVLS
jgi:hypothetical protein